VKIVVVIPTLDEDTSKTIRSIQDQTVKASKILVAVGSKKLYERLSTGKSAGVQYFYVQPDFRQPLGKRVAIALNTILAKANIREYDYILKVDADATLPKHFIEENLKENADCLGGSGYAMLITVSAFLEVFNGKFAEVAADDTYLGLAFRRRGYLVKGWRVPPMLRKKRPHSYRWYLTRGAEMYKMGYEPIHVLERLRGDRRGVLYSLGYISAMFKRAEQYALAPWVFRTQTRRLIYGKERAIG
jgi:glycosyltransferase involved in cell wall biosynthesis